MEYVYERTRKKRKKVFPFTEGESHRGKWVKGEDQEEKEKERVEEKSEDGRN